ncbi:MAG: IS66 family insertion sequence element accessory protein TnpB [Acidobacteriaceae bacterium]|nr:IS66 family insertion sequence element accessory protein TnpB [Acidobacteriaceae bacterium]MBV9305234.1 IS66 family insertion sequence element accessory protein TnpB [Acidobacteriaceae bacterium]
MIGLPSLAALDGAAGPRIWLAAEATDMRCGFDWLAARVEAVTGESPMSGHLFVFRSRCSSRLKLLAWIATVLPFGTNVLKPGCSNCHV